MQPVKASGWFNSGLIEEDKATLLKAGIVPVNDVFYNVWNSDYAINLFYGGYGSGKSVFMQTKLLEKCRKPNYFKCYYGRKVMEDVRGSVHSKFVTLIKDLGLQAEFSYSEQPNGSMIIKHIATGNSFHPFGASTIDGLKSIDDPTDFLLEEMDQFTGADFAIILSRLRTKKAKLQLWGAFNNAAVLPGHWIIKTFFPEMIDVLDGNTDATDDMVKLIEEIGVNKIFCNYTDNYFIDQQDYYNRLKLTAAGDSDYLESIANGAWGTVKAIRPFAHQYNESTHTSSQVAFSDTRQLLISIDFNLDPFGAIFANYWRDEEGEHLHVVSEMSFQNGSIPEMIDRINSKYGHSLYACQLTGDAMGKNRTMGERDNASNYEQLRRGLNLNSRQLKLPANPTHSNSRADVNYFLANFPDFKINGQLCPNLRRDLRLVEVDAFGDIIKRNRNNVSELADHLDCLRYMVNTFFKEWIEKDMKRKRIISK